VEVLDTDATGVVIEVAPLLRGDEDTACSAVKGAVKVDLGSTALAAELEDPIVIPSKAEITGSSGCTGTNTSGTSEVDWTETS
jgi:hypothetical protein